MTLRDKIHLKIAKDRDCHDEGCPDCLALTDAILSLVTDVVEREVIGEDEASVLDEKDNLIPDQGERRRNKLRAEQRTRLMQVGKEK